MIKAEWTMMEDSTGSTIIHGSGRKNEAVIWHYVAAAAALSAALAMQSGGISLKKQTSQRNPVDAPISGFPNDICWLKQFEAFRLPSSCLSPTLSFLRSRNGVKGEAC
jgi:hypothetical protein